MARKFVYYSNCVMWNPQHADDLEKLIDEEVEVDYAEIAANISKEELDAVFPMYAGGTTLTLKTDWCVRYFKSTLFGKPCYMIRHSAIEYVFI